MSEELDNDYTMGFNEEDFPEGAPDYIEQSNKKECNHFMVWNCQGGYSYRRCSKCDYIDGKETFKDREKAVLDEVEGLIEKHKKVMARNVLGWNWQWLIDDIEKMKQAP